MRTRAAPALEALPLPTQMASVFHAASSSSATSIPLALLVLLIACSDEARRATTGTASSTVEPARIAEQPQPGETPPNFTLPDQNGGMVTLSENRGQKVVLVFYRGHW